MRSIRRSLILWFLGLTVLTLGVAGWLVDGIVGRAIRDREQSATDLVLRQFEQRKQEELDRVDQSLLDEARAIAQSMQFLYANNFQSVSQPIRHAWLSAIGFGPVNPLAGLNVAIIGLPGPYHFEYLSKRPLDDSILNRVTDEEHFRDYYQVHTFFNNILKSKSLDDQPLPEFNRPKINATLPNWLPADEVTLVDGTPVRRIIYASPIYVRQVGPIRRPPGGDRQGGSGGRERGAISTQASPPPTRPQPTPEQIIREQPRIYVQTARPIAIIDLRFSAFAEECETELVTVRAESAAAIARTRGVLATLAFGAIAAMLLGSLMLISRGLAPVNKLSQAVSEVSEKDFRLPIAAKDLSVELLPVHERISATLEALRRAFEREKQAVADISHELRTPVASLAATIDVSLRKPRSADQYKATLEECRDINRQLGRLVERVMTLANLDSGNDRSITAPCNAAELAKECALLIRPLAEAHGLSVQVDVQPAQDLTTDVDKVREVLMNLLHNAVEYTPSGGRIVISSKPAHRGVEFVVRDTGIGMTTDVKERIFERFYRADPSRTATGIHAGLGLAIVKEYLKRLGGTVNVVSRPGDGSTFTVTIPSLSV